MRLGSCGLRRVGSPRIPVRGSARGLALPTRRPRWGCETPVRRGSAPRLGSAGGAEATASGPGRPR
eukprot:2493201-Lingulodinium_polyedra.AAC.1